MNSNELYLNGPSNFFKLKNNEKEIYLFGNIQHNIEDEMECDELESYNFDKYLKYFFKHNKKNIDFMMETEIKPTNTYNKEINYEYIEKLKKLFQEIYDKDENYEHLKIHYIDVTKKNDIQECCFLLSDIYQHLNNYMYDIDYIINKLEHIKEILYYFNDIIEKYKKNEKAIVDKNIMIDDIFYKIIVKYNNVENKKKINKYFDMICFKKIKYIIELIDKYVVNFNKYKKTIESKKNNNYDEHLHKNESVYKQLYLMKSYYDTDEYAKIKKEIDDIINEIDIHIYTLIKAVMDCYFMRRFVDKPYIKNVIAYTGILNTVSCLYFLVKYYDYKILEYSFINKVDSKELEKIIKKTDSYLDIYEYIYVDKQCIKIKQLFKE